MPFHFPESVSWRGLARARVSLLATLPTSLVAVSLAATALLQAATSPVLAQECPVTPVTGSIGSGDGSTIPGPVGLWVMTGSQTIYTGHYAPGSVTLTNLGTNGNLEGQFTAFHDRYFWSPITGSITCVRDEETPFCSSCSGGFDVKLYASHGAIEGTLDVQPVPPTGLAGFEVSIARTPTGPFIGTTTDADGHFEFRASDEPDRSNNWGVSVDPAYSPEPHSGTGQATYFVRADGAIRGQVPGEQQQAQHVRRDDRQPSRWR